ncbi:MAG TPA: GNAT family N-acetyltransferase [Levilinea sp.]|nr:GNAT family N-acetyltransferase [Levilinea sp.]
MNTDLANVVTLRDIAESDLPIFFQHQRDPQACYMAAFTPENPADGESFYRRWSGFLANESMFKKTILCDGNVAGHLIAYKAGRDLLTYWIGKEFWGRGVATRAVSEFLKIMTVRPLYAYVAVDHIASLRVLHKNGFLIIDQEVGYANARGGELEEFLLELNPSSR